MQLPGRKILIVLATAAIGMSVARANYYVDVMTNGFQSACPTYLKPCAIQYWQGSVTHMQNVVAALQNAVNQPGFHQWCGTYPAECAYYQEHLGMAMYAVSYAQFALNFWQNF